MHPTNMDLAKLELVTQPSAVASSQPLLQSPLLARWHLLSLDAPMVAATWMILFAKQAGSHLPPTEPAGMFCVVWSLYAADRLLDAKAVTDAAQPPTVLEARHHFAWNNRWAFLYGIVAAWLTSAFLLRSFPANELLAFALVGTLLAAWFALIHRSQWTLPKELMVGVFFAAAVSLPIFVREPKPWPTEFLPVILFAALCSLNCIFISAWEDDGQIPLATHPATRWAAKQRLWIALALALFALACGQRILASAALLLVLIDLQRTQLERTTLRALADAALFVPALVGIVYR